MPMMATPVAIALVWTMMFHPQLGVLNYLLSLVGIPPFAWVYDPATVIPTLVLVEVWHWTPLVMLIVLGGLAGLPTDPYEAALIDGASSWQMFRYITWPLILPYVMIALVIRTIDSLKVFDTIAVISQGGPGTASETLNYFLYLQAFQFYNLGYASAVVVIFFVIIIALSLLLLYARQQHEVDGLRGSSDGIPVHAWRASAASRSAPGSRSACRCVFLVSPAVLVFLWMLSLSLKTEIDNIAFPPVFIPSPPTLANYVEVFEKNRILLYFWNSVLVTGGAVLVGLVVGVPAGYGIARAKAAKAAILILIARMTPALSYLIPLFLLFQVIGLIGTIWALVITHLVITIPIIVWVMIGYFENVPQELEDAARVDGANVVAELPPHRAAAGAARHRGRRHPRLHLLLEQLHLLGGAGRQEHAHAAVGRLQHADLRAARLGPAGGRRPAGDAARAAGHRDRPARDHRRPVVRRAEGRLSHASAGAR